MPSKHVRKFKVVGIGEVLWDIYRESRFLGGAPANVAVHASQLGDDGIVVSRIGNDGMGNELIRALKEKGLSTEYLQVDQKKGTGTVHISLSVSGEPSFFCTEDVAFDYLQFTPRLKELAEQSDAVVFGTLAQRHAVSRQTIQQFLQHTKGMRVFDVNARHAGSGFQEIVQASLTLATVLKMNEVEIELLKQSFRKEGDGDVAFARYLIDRFDLEFVVLTQGVEGAAIVLENDLVVEKAPEIRVVDATGAGDAFTAALVHTHLRGLPPAPVLRFANAIAAFVCTQKGATPPIPLELLQRLRREVQL